MAVGGVVGKTGALRTSSPFFRPSCLSLANHGVMSYSASDMVAPNAVEGALNTISMDRVTLSSEPQCARGRYAWLITEVGE
jgi:hypothetical protein